MNELLDLVVRYEFKNIRLNIFAWSFQATSNAAKHELFDTLTTLNQSLNLFKHMQNDTSKPFETHMTTSEKTNPENIEMLEGYNSEYRQTFLPYFKNELKQVLLAKNPKTEIHTLNAARENLQTVSDIHTNPEKHLTSDFKTSLPEVEPSKFKKYLTRASIIVGGILLAAMTIKFLPLTLLVASVIHIAMYATLGIGTYGIFSS